MGESKTTKRQLKRIIKEEKAKLLLKENRISIGDMFAAAALMLDRRNGEGIEQIASEVRDLLMPEAQRHQYARALEAMAEAAYELAEYEENAR
jgi:hypothetical protein